ncbi:hypothetical protein [Methanobacterium sp.]|uniref:hypothetical protein n=1 Tax=Methanobacterium sp. TaxID=2164 RepID=UPI0031591AF7
MIQLFNMVKKSESEMFLKIASNCKPEELKDVLKKVESAIEKSVDKDKDLLMAKTIITARLTSMRN